MRHSHIPFCILALILGGVTPSFAQHIPLEMLEAGDAERREYEFTRSRDPKTNDLPENIKQREHDFISNLPSRDPFASYKGNPNNNTPLAQTWQNVGPYNQSGRIQALAIDVADTRNMLAGSASGGVWRTIDRGMSWVKVTLPNEVQSISSIVQDKRQGKTATWYYGTSELLSTTDRPHTSNIRTHSSGNGIYSSNDNGATWSPIPSTQSRNGFIAPSNFQGVWNIVLDHRNISQNVMYASCFGGIMRSSDGGISWKLVLGSDTLQCFNSDIVIGTSGTLYAALSSTFDGTQSPKQGIWSSTDGISWKKIDDQTLPVLFRRIKIAVAPSNDSILYSFVEAPEFWVNVDESFESKHALLRYEIKKDGSKWEDITPSLNKLLDDEYAFRTLAGYAIVLAVKPDNPNAVFFGGTNLYVSFQGLRDTGDYLKIGGYPYTLSDIDLHPDMHALAFDPTNANMLFIGCDGGVFSTDNYTVSAPIFQSYPNGLTTSQFYDAKLDERTSGDGFIVGGLQDNSSYATRDAKTGAKWEVATGGDGMTSGSILGKELFVTSLQGGRTFFLGYDVDDTLRFYGQAIPDDPSAQFRFFTKFSIDPYSHNTMLLPATNELWRLQGLQDVLITGVDNTGWQRYTNVGAVVGKESFITTMAMPYQDDAEIFIGTSSGKIYKLPTIFELDATPKEFTSPLFPKNGFLTHIEADRQDAKHIIAVFSNYNVLSIFESTNGGNSWHPISGNLEQNADGSGAGPSIRTVRILHTPNNTMYYAGTSSGLFSTNKIDGMNTVWVREGATTIGSLIVESVDVREGDGKVIAATQGGGVFSNVGAAAVAMTTMTSPLLTVDQNFPNPVTSSTRVHFYLSKANIVTIELFDALGKKLSTIDNSFYGEGDHLLSFGLNEKPFLHLANGSYFYRISAGDQAVTKQCNIKK